MARTRLLLVLALLALASGLAALPGTQGFQDGISGRAVSGCTCHGASPTPGVTPAIAGLPTVYDPGAAYTLTVSVSGGPAKGGGFDLLVDGGALAPGDANVQAFSSLEVGHNNPNELQWSVHWTAPSNGTASVTFYLSTNSVNKDGTEAGDAWNQMRAVVAPRGAPGAPSAAGPSEPSVLLLVAAPALALAALAALAWTRPAPPSPLARRPRLALAAPHLAVLLTAFAIVLVATAEPGGGSAHGPRLGGPGSAPLFESHDFTGTTSDGQSSTQPVDLNAGTPSAVHAVLTWTDEPDLPRHTNLPDSFRLTLSAGDLQVSGNGTNAHGAPGTIDISLDLSSAAGSLNASSITAVVTCVNAGAQQGVPAGLGLRDRPDSGNDWALTVNASIMAGTGPAARAAQAAASSGGEPAFSAHAAVEAVAAVLVAAALVAVLALHGAIPPSWVPPRLRPTRARHALLGAVAVAATGLAAVIGLWTAADQGMLISAHGVAGIALVALLAVQAAAGYLTLRGRPLKRAHGLIAAATVGVLLAQGIGGLGHYLPG